MRRGTSHEKTTNLLKEFRKSVPDMAIRTTLIVGYPGETEENFQELKHTHNLLKSLNCTVNWSCILAETSFLLLFIFDEIEFNLGREDWRKRRICLGFLFT